MTTTELVAFLREGIKTARDPEQALLLASAATEIERLLRERDECLRSADIEHAAATFAIKRLVQHERRILPCTKKTAEQHELETTADIYSELGGGPPPETAVNMGLPELETHRLRRERDEARAAVKHSAETCAYYANRTGLRLSTDYYVAEAYEETGGTPPAD